MARRRSPAGPAQSQRQLRVGEDLRHVLAELLLRGEVHDPLLAASQLTVAEVRMTPDLRHAAVFVTELGGELRAELREALARAAPRLRGGRRGACTSNTRPSSASGPDTFSRGGPDRSPDHGGADHPCRPARGRRWAGLEAWR